MSEILYNTNSTFISKFHQQQQKITSDIVVQKKNARTPSEGPPKDIPFRSQFPKETDEYLKDLCKSIYPETLRPRIDSITTSSRLNFHALVALVVKSFVLSWYGVKITTIDYSKDEFLTSIFNVADETYLSLCEAIETRANMEQFILEQLPLVISSHLRILRELSRNDCELLNIENYCKLNCIPSGSYLQDCYSNLILKNFTPNKSIVQETFLDSILQNLVFGSILESISNTFYILELLNTIITKLNDTKRDGASAQQNKNNVKKTTTTPLFNQRTSEFKSILLSLVLMDILQLPTRNPIWFSILSLMAKLALYIPFLKSFLEQKTHHYLDNLLAGLLDASYLMRKLRNNLFPNDNMMGQRRIIPEGKELEQYKKQVIQNITSYFKKNHLLQTALMITEEQITDFVNLISLDNQCNQIFLLQLMEPFVVMLLSEKKS